ncbi:MAG TPA: tetratricopeptide repeat protein [Verrucomicrobiae bacterium]|nr:tetratricopeptide repeat protein [Verrucomicrobiae bacterium]
MTTAREVSPENRFVSAVLPWLVAAVAALLYLLTLNHWVSFSSLLPVARTSGWIWQPSLTEPLYWLITAPLRLLPPASVPLTLNLFALVCAVLSLALLARSVSLLPHDRTKEQRIREGSPSSLLSVRAAWLPPILAAAVCGLQLTFWENATAASVEMLNLLLFAYVIRCLLEYRIDNRESWLLKAAVVYGAGMANNWAMIGFFPLFIAALVWIKGLAFFDGRFLGRMFVVGMAGLSLYLLLPAVTAVTTGGEVSFWQALRSNLTTQKSYLAALVFSKDALLNGDRPLWVLGLPSLLPILALSIRWPSFMGDISKLGVALANLAFHVIFGVLLFVCLWVALDPQFSPREYQPLLGNYGILLLPFYYLAALSIGYFVGYYLLVFGVTPSGRQRFRKTYPPIVNNAVLCLVCALAVLTPCLMLLRNFPQVRRSNGSQLRQYAALTLDKLPPSGGIVLSDDPRRMLLMQSAVTQAGKSKDYVLVDTGSLEFPEYYKFLKKQYPARWQVEPPKEVKQVANTDLQRLIYMLSQTNAVYYLHPSFGYYFEILYPTPHGLVYSLHPYTDNSVLAPPPDAKVIAENEAFWAQAEERALREVASAVAPAKPIEQQGLLDRIAAGAHLAVETNRDAQIIGTFYSQCLNFWAVQLQRQNQLKQAATYFSQALELNPNNVVAEVNLECNRNLQAGRETTVQISKAIEDKFGHRTWDQIMRENGPFDEPNFCFAQGSAFVQGGNNHQAALQFERVRALQPKNLPAQLALAQIYFFNHLPDDALKVIDSIHAANDAALASPTNTMQLLGIEASAHLAKGDLKGAESIVNRAVSRFPQEPDLLATAAKVYMDFGLYTNALQAIERQLQIRPDDPGALFSKGNACLQLNEYEKAIDPLTRVVGLETNNFSKAHYLAQFMRAKAYLGLGKLGEAKQDYIALSHALPKEFPVYFDLAEIAYREKDTNAVRQYYQLYKANVPTNFVDDIKVADSRLAELKNGSP